ncbi:Acetyltransferase (GNAT) domain-containing protein [Amphritea atlantica]|uniref:Acetyltransferase (GNAT) domain-containing protein n=1 Tax=Amphritea atlantica TaxID=355243 RepID=A0A1H9HUP9_9GAMM|nr:GNAT family N-acetyltransferase [Amphritea atlantica]SEQ66050.1 Acetyltransferase (GNAT) domain-containing protein [Amphritea atlantica]
MKSVFRTFEPSDLESLVALMKQLGYEHTMDSLAANVRRVKTREGEVFVAEVNGKVVGVISAIMDVRLAEGVSGEIVSLVVSDQARGLGLVLMAEAWLKQYTSNIRVRANVLRTEAHDFYEKQGYRLKKRQAVFQKEW